MRNRSPRPNTRVTVMECSIRRMLQGVGSGVESETVLTHSTGMDYSTLAERIGERMSKQ